ncbi:YggS family pyridoxal phosphate enzyme [Magnetospirillum sp. ME-1]|uniref:YggS family pyridoxal phosphate-dependent enzyme n=1 Tax=Magnetospirillum sp. ME-1 TaxID=1639348 RepID=UPI000A179ED5|nr:YggS family pyridoxal phosphate-dependent enzyme [Magnetospirillum sp. ME-1]ARJ66476.1 YggS family pyridoxal phosphate enzyme [Magnetospirillum sp. ME-1]
MSAITAGLHAVQSRIKAAAQGRSVSLVAVAKTYPAEAVREALAAGQRVFGENRVQEAKAKFTDLRKDHPELELHLIGPLQTNKVRDAVALFDVIETIDRPKLARAVADEMRRSGRRPLVLIQVNTGREPQKAGIDPDQVESMVAICRDEYGLPLAGLMCIPPAKEDPTPHFRLLAGLAARHGLGVVSMGMSGDFEAAIAEGATHVRVGSAIFGHRG